MSHQYVGPLAAYNSLTDKHLTGYFNNTRIKRHLRRVGLITRSGRILSEKEYRLNAMRKDQQKYVRECLAQAIFHKVLDMERHHHIEIKRKLENFARKERIQKTKVDLSKRPEEEANAFFSPRPPTGPKSSYGRHILHDEERSDFSESPSSSRPNTAPGNMQRPVRLEPLPATAGLATVPKSNSAIQTKTSALEIDHPFPAGVDKDFMKYINAMDPSSGISPYRLPVLNNYVIPVPPPPKNRDMNPNMTKSGTSRGRRFRPTTAPIGMDQLSTKDPVRFHKTSLHSNVSITMIYLGKTVHLSNEDMEYKDEIKVFQQHCGGENLCIYKGTLLEGETFQCTSRRHRGFPFSLTFYINAIQVDRLSSCCEYKHRRGARLGGKHGYFKFLKIEGASPCYRCIIAMGLDKKPSPPPKKRKEDHEDEDYEDLKVETMMGKMASEEESQRERTPSVTSSAYRADREMSEDKSEMGDDEDDEEDREVFSSRDESKDDLDEENEETKKEEYDEDFDADDEKVDEEVNGDDQVDDHLNGQSPPPRDDEKEDLDLEKEDGNSSEKAPEATDSDKEEGDDYCDTEFEQEEKQERKKDPLVSPSRSALYNSSSGEESDVEERIKGSGHEDSRRASSKGTPTNNYSALRHDVATEDQIQTEDSADENTAIPEVDTIDDDADVEDGAVVLKMKGENVKGGGDSGHSSLNKYNFGEHKRVEVLSGVLNEGERLSMQPTEDDDDDGDSKSIQEKIAEAIGSTMLLSTEPEPEPSDSSTDEEENGMRTVPERDEGQDVQIVTEETMEDSFCLEHALDTEGQPMDGETQIEETTIKDASMLVLGEVKKTQTGTGDEATAMEETSEHVQPELEEKEKTDAENQDIKQRAQMKVTKEDEAEGQIINDETVNIVKSTDQETETETSIDEKSKTEDAFETVEGNMTQDLAPRSDRDDVLSQDNGLEGIGPESSETVIDGEEAVEDVTSREEIEEVGVTEMGMEVVEKSEGKTENKVTDEQSSLLEEDPNTPAIGAQEMEGQYAKSPQELESANASSVVNDEEIFSNKMGEEVDALLDSKGTETEAYSEETMLEKAVPDGEVIEEDATRMDDPAVEEVAEELVSERERVTEDIFQDEEELSMDGVPNEEEMVFADTSKTEDDMTEESFLDEKDTTMVTTPEGKEEDVETTAQTYESLETAAHEEEGPVQETAMVEVQAIPDTVVFQKETLSTGSQGNDSDREDAPDGSEEVTEAGGDDELCIDESPERKEPFLDEALDEEELTTAEGGNTITEATPEQDEEKPSEDHEILIEADSEGKEVMDEIVSEDDGQAKEINGVTLGVVQEKDTGTEPSLIGDSTSPEDTPNADEIRQETPPEGVQTMMVTEAGGIGQEEVTAEACIDEEDETKIKEFKGEEETLRVEEETVTEADADGVGLREDLTESGFEGQHTSLQLVPKGEETEGQEANIELSAEEENELSETTREVEELDSGVQSQDDGGELASEVAPMTTLSVLDEEEDAIKMIPDGEETTDSAGNEEAAPQIDGTPLEIGIEEGEDRKIAPTGEGEVAIADESETAVEKMEEEGETIANKDMEEAKEFVPEEMTILEGPEKGEEAVSDAALKFEEVITGEAPVYEQAGVSEVQAIEDSDEVCEEVDTDQASVEKEVTLVGEEAGQETASNGYSQEEGGSEPTEEPEQETELISDGTAIEETVGVPFGSEGIADAANPVAEMTDKVSDELKVKPEETVVQSEEAAGMKAHPSLTEGDEMTKSTGPNFGEMVSAIKAEEAPDKYPHSPEATAGEEANSA